MQAEERRILTERQREQEERLAKVDQSDVYWAVLLS